MCSLQVLIFKLSLSTGEGSLCKQGIRVTLESCTCTLIDYLLQFKQSNCAPLVFQCIRLNQLLIHLFQNPRCEYSPACIRHCCGRPIAIWSEFRIRKTSLQDRYLNAYMSLEMNSLLHKITRRATFDFF